MSFIVTIAVKDGIIMLGDMLCSNNFENKNLPGVHIAGTNFYKKLFTMNDNIGISFCGNGTYEDWGQELNQNVNEFCNKKSFDNPQDAAYALLDYILYGDNKTEAGKHHAEEMKKRYAAGGEPQFVAHVAGYFKHKEKGLIQPSVYTICTVRSLLQEGWKRIGYEGDTGLWQCGNMRQIKHYVDMIKKDKEFIDHLTLQEAVNAVKFIFDTARGFEWLVDHIVTISENFEMLAITNNGIKWLKKHELELEEKQEVIL